MRTRRHIFFTFLGVVIFASFGLPFIRSQPLGEPTFQGKSAAYWISQPTTGSNRADWEKVYARQTALEQLSNSVAPLLLDRLHANYGLYDKLQPSVASHAGWLGQFLPKPAFTTAAEATLARREAAALLGRPEFWEAGDASSQPTELDLTLFKALWDDDDHVRLWALAALRHRGRIRNPAFMNRLIQLLDDPVDRVKREAAAGLVAFGTNAVAAVPKLAANLQKNDARLREASANALASIGPQALPAVYDLRQLLSAHDLSVRLAASRALWLIAQEDDATMPVFVQALGSRDGDVQLVAVATLEKMGPRASNAIPALIVGLSDEEARVRLACSNALRQISPRRRSRARPPQAPIAPSHFTESTAFDFTRSISTNHHTYIMSGPFY